MAHIQNIEIVTAGAGTAERQISIPPDALGLVGFTWNPVGAFTRHVAVEVVTAENRQRVLGFLAFRGLKTSIGFYPTTTRNSLLCGITVAAADAAFTYTLFAHFLVPDQGDAKTPLMATPFECAGGNDQIVSLTATSDANAAQTVDVAVLGNVDGIQPLAAWFYNSGAGTATGETDAFDGTTAVTIDSTAAVAEYTFNLGAKGSQLIIADPAAGNNLWRCVIGAGGAGITTTLVMVYRAVLLR